MSDLEDYKKEKQAFIEARKLRASTTDGGAGMLKEEPVRIVPVTFKEKWDNYWYHYKGRTFGIVIAAILVTVFTCDLIFKTVYDGSIAVITQYPMDALSERFTSAFSNPVILKETSGNEKLDMEILPMQLDFEGNYGGGNPQAFEANVVKLSARVSTLDGFIYLVDQSSYDYLLTMGMSFMDLSTMTDKSHLSDGNDKYSLKGTKLAEDIGIGELLDDLYICFFDYNTLDQKRQDKKGIKAAYQRDILLFENILAYE